MEHLYQLRIYPDGVQKKIIQRTFGCCRFVYNYFLLKCKTQHKHTKEFPTLDQQEKMLTALISRKGWLQTVDRTALQTSLETLGIACQRFSQRVSQGEHPYYPRFKRKEERQPSYEIRGKIKLQNGGIRFPYIGRVRCRITEKIEGEVLSATITRNSWGEYFISLRTADT